MYGDGFCTESRSSQMKNSDLPHRKDASRLLVVDGFGDDLFCPPRKKHPWAGEGCEAAKPVHFGWLSCVRSGAVDCEPRDTALACGQAVHDEVRDASGRGRIEIRKHHDDVASLRKDLQITVHPGRAAAVAEVAHRRPGVAIHEAEGVLRAARCIDFSAAK